MTCRREAGGCGHEFCWICMGDWSTHGSATGGYYQCNLYDDKKKNNANFAEEEQKRANAQNELTRYSHYFTRYNEHDRSSKIAVNQREKVANTQKILHEFMAYPPAELNFLTEALEAVIYCRQVLKWTYAYGFYKALEM